MVNIIPHRSIIDDIDQMNLINRDQVQIKSNHNQKKTFSNHTKHHNMRNKNGKKPNSSLWKSF